MYSIENTRELWKQLKEVFLQLVHSCYLTSLCQADSAFLPCRQTITATYTYNVWHSNITTAFAGESVNFSAREVSRGVHSPVHWLYSLLGANEHSSKSKYTLNWDVETTTQLVSSLDASPLFWATVHCENSEEQTLALSTSSSGKDHFWNTQLES